MAEALDIPVAAVPQQRDPGVTFQQRPLRAQLCVGPPLVKESEDIVIGTVVIGEFMEKQEAVRGQAFGHRRQGFAQIGRGV